MGDFVGRKEVLGFNVIHVLSWVNPQHLTARVVDIKILSFGSAPHNHVAAVLDQGDKSLALFRDQFLICNVPKHRNSPRYFSLKITDGPAGNDNVNASGFS